MEKCELGLKPPLGWKSSLRHMNVTAKDIALIIEIAYS